MSIKTRKYSRETGMVSETRRMFSSFTWSQGCLKISSADNLSSGLVFSSLLAYQSIVLEHRFEHMMIPQIRSLMLNVKC